MFKSLVFAVLAFVSVAADNAYACGENIFRDNYRIENVDLKTNNIFLLQVDLIGTRCGSYTFLKSDAAGAQKMAQNIGLYADVSIDLDSAAVDAEGYNGFTKYSINRIVHQYENYAVYDGVVTKVKFIKAEKEYSFSKDADQFYQVEIALADGQVLDAQYVRSAYSLNESDFNLSLDQSVDVEKTVVQLSVGQRVRVQPSTNDAGVKFLGQDSNILLENAR